MRISALNKGDTVGIVVPAGKINEEVLLKGIQVIESWGLKVKLGKHCFAIDKNYLAAPDADRLDDLQQMLDDKSIVAIFCGRGGYGTTRILDQLDFEKFVRNPKWIIGFSDITALHLKIHQLGFQSIHGCMPSQYSKPEYEESVESLRQILFANSHPIIAEKGNSYNRNGIGKGQVIGGNLSLLADSLGTASAPDTTGKILIVEEVDELRYKIDRMMMQLKRAGKLSQLSGLVVGHMTNLKDTERPFNFTMEEIMLDKVSEYSYPVAFNFPIGHEAPNLAWRYGASSTLLVDGDTSSLTFD